MRSAMAITVRNGETRVGVHMKRTKSPPSRRIAASTSWSSVSKAKTCSAWAWHSSSTMAWNSCSLLVEVDVERALGDAGAPRDLAHAGRVEALVEEHLACALHDLAALGAFGLFGGAGGSNGHVLRTCAILTEPFGQP